MPDLVSSLSVILKDGVSGPAKTVAASVKSLESELKGAQNKLKLSMGDFKVSRKGFNEAKRHVEDVAKLRADLQKKLASFGDIKPAKTDALFASFKALKDQAKSVEVEYSRAQKTVSRSASQFAAHADAAKAAFKQVNALKYDAVIAEEKRLQDALSHTASAYAKRHHAMPSGAAGAPPVGAAPNAPARGSRVGTGGRRVTAFQENIKAGAGAVAGWNLWQWLRDGIATGYDFQQEANKLTSQGQASPEDREQLSVHAQREASKNGYTTALENVQIMNEFLKAGFSPEATKASLPNAAGLARFGDVDSLDAVDTLISTAYGLRMPLGNEAEAGKTTQEIADKIAKAAAITRGGVPDYKAGLKFSSGFGGMMGLTIDQLLALNATMVQRGQSGQEAGVAVRSLLNTSVKPTIGARQALAEMGMNIGDYATGEKEFDAYDQTAGMESRFGKMPTGTAEKLEKAMAKVAAGTFDERSAAMADFFIKATKAKSAQDKEKVVNASRQQMEAMIEGTDVEALLEDLQDKKVTANQVSRILGSKQGSRLMAVLQDKMYQDLLAQISGTAPGTAEKQAELSLANGVGGIKKGANNMRNNAITVTQAAMRAPMAVSGAVSDVVTSLPTRNNSQVDRFGRYGQNKAAQPTVMVETAPADKEIEGFKAKLLAMNGMSVQPTVSLSGIDAAIARLQELIGLIGVANSSSRGVGSGTRAIHADGGSMGTERF